jgi:hypothetical protein
MLTGMRPAATERRSAFMGFLQQTNAFHPEIEHRHRYIGG